DCEGMLVAPCTKNRHELSSQLSSDVSEVIIKNTEIRDNEPFEVLENTENINDESFQLTILNEQRVD
ncbi:19732_t:CDS:1, partial [Rhizophagus irregularis]